MPATRVTSGFASRAGGAVASLLLVWTVLASPPARAVERSAEQFAPGVEVAERRGDSLVVHVARVSPDAPVQVKAVLAGGRIVGERREATSAVCAREGATVCVNADFAACQTCREVFGGFARGGVVRRSFHPHHEQFSVTSTGFSSKRPTWRGELRATLRWPTEEPAATDPLSSPPPPTAFREETHRLSLDALNRLDDGHAVLFSADWGTATTPSEGRRELVVAIDADVPAGSHGAELLELREGGPVSTGQVAVRTDAGAATEFWDAWMTSTAPQRELVLETVPEPVLESVGAHPVLLRDGHRAPLDKTDGKVTQRHPRTLVGWTSEGSLLLVTIDGRQPGWSKGATLEEATDILVSLGASDALNLDGGGSSTFVTSCDGDMCVRNRPSDGGERAVPAVLAVVVDDGVVVTSPAPVPDPPRTAAGSAPATEPTEPAVPPAEAPPPPPLAPAPAPPEPPAPAEVHPPPQPPPPTGDLAPAETPSAPEPATAGPNWATATPLTTSPGAAVRGQGPGVQDQTTRNRAAVTATAALALVLSATTRLALRRHRQRRTIG